MQTEEQDEQLTLLEDKAARFKFSFRLLGKEEVETNKEEVITAWKLILRNYVRDIFDLLNLLKENIAWSLLDDKKERFYQVKIEWNLCLPTIKTMKEKKCAK